MIVDITVKKIDEIWGRLPCPSKRIGRWVTFVFCLFLLWTFIFILAPWIEKSPYVQPLAQFIDESGIDASALFYTEIEESGEAELILRSTMERNNR